MDSITQVVLGAACGEAVAGRKIGNRAMIWGGIGGTLPDLDVLSNVVMDPLQAMLFHRGPMHSLSFAVVMPFIIGPLVKKLYDKPWPEKPFWRWFGFGIGAFLFAVSAILICIVAGMLKGGVPWLVIGACTLLGGLFFYRRFLHMRSEPFLSTNLSSAGWIQLFFWSIFTHPLLDSLTTYGTQLFWPFNHYRVTISSVSIVDPLYTVPFAVFLLLAALRPATSKMRLQLVWIGIGVSSLYQIFAFCNKQYVDHLFKQKLEQEGISYSKQLSVPTLFNNMLWYAIAETDSGYVYSYYSHFDKEADFEKPRFIRASHELLEPYKGQDIAKALPWFSFGFYNLMKKSPTELQFNDLRFGSMSGRMDRAEDFIFHMSLEDLDGTLKFKKESRPENKREDIEWFKDRIFGKRRPEG